MKKKKLKNALLCALAVPCMFGLTACGDTGDSGNAITTAEYTNLVYEAGKNYITNHTDYKTFGDMSTTFKLEATHVSKVEFEYKESAEATELTTKEFDLTTTNIDTQTIDINRDETENGDISMKITYNTKTTYNGKRANEETQLLESYESSEESTKIVTLLKEGTSYKFYEYEKTVNKMTGEDDVTEETKKVYTFESQEDYQEAVEYLIDEVNNKQVFDMLSASGDILFSNPEIYKDGNNFGLEFSYSGVSLDGYEEMVKNTMTTSLDFKNSLPYKTTAEMGGESMNGESDKNKQTITITYSAPAITAPDGSADYTEDTGLNYSNIQIKEVGFYM